MNDKAQPLPRAGEVRAAGSWDAGAAADRVVLDYEARFLRRRVLTCEGGLRVLVDLPQTTSLDHGAALDCGDGQLIEVVAAPEPVLRVSGDLPRLAWHIGNRHTPCQMAGDHLVIRNDPVIRHMLEHLDASITEAHAPFTPEGGAYGHGRTHSHEHGHTAHEH